MSVHSVSNSIHNSDAVNNAKKKDKKATFHENICKHEISFQGNDYAVEFLKSKASKESGGSEQMKVKLIGARKIYGRVKQLDTLNEAIIYHKLNASDDPLKPYVPTFIAAFDEKGNWIDLENELKNKSVEELCKEYPVAYIMMKDLTRGLPEKAKLDNSRKINDFKFVKPSLIGNDQEMEKHSHIPRSKFYKKTRDIYFSQSNCSFAFQRSTKSKWYSWLFVNIKRLIAIKKTKSKLRAQFDLMEKDELIKNIELIKNLKKDLQTSEFAFADSSLLFIPTTKMVDGNEVKSGLIHLIDFGHAVSRDEDIDAFDTMQQEMAESLEELLLIMDKSLKKKQIEIIHLGGIKNEAVDFKNRHKPLYLDKHFYERTVVKDKEGNEMHFYGETLKPFIEEWIQKVKIGATDQTLDEYLTEHVSENEQLASQKVHYLTDEERQKTLVTIENGELKQIGLRNAEEDMKPLAAGSYIFVVAKTADEEGNLKKSLFMASKEVTDGGKIQHSSFLNGASVLSAGKITINDEGKIEEVFNQSGHYRPTSKELAELVKYLKDENYDLTSFNVKSSDNVLVHEFHSRHPKFTLGIHVQNAEEWYRKTGRKILIQARKAEKNKA